MKKQPRPRQPEVSQVESARWLFDFSERDLSELSKLSKESKLTLLLRAREFAWQPAIPSEHDLPKAQSWLRRCWKTLAVGGPLRRKRLELVWYGDNRLQRLPVDITLRWLDRFKGHVHDTLESVEDRFKFCHNDTCRRPFLANKRQVYCSSACSQAFRTRRYRSENRERFRARRREAYKRQQAQKLGVSAIRIQS